MPFQYFTGSPIKFVPIDKSQKQQSTNPFAPSYIAPPSDRYYPPIFYEMRPKIILKYGGRCFLCGDDGNDVHHIDYDKMHCDEDNLVLLCKTCHGLTNFDKDYWKNFIKEKMGQKEI